MDTYIKALCDRVEVVMNNTYLETDKGTAGWRIYEFGPDDKGRILDLVGRVRSLEASLDALRKKPDSVDTDPLGTLRNVLGRVERLENHRAFTP